MKMGYVSCTFSFLKMTDDRFVQSYKSPAFHPKIRIVALQNAPENPKACVSHKMFSPCFVTVHCGIDLQITGKERKFGAQMIVDKSSHSSLGHDKLGPWKCISVLTFLVRFRTVI